MTDEKEILRAEREGQTQLVASNWLPVRTLVGQDTKARYEAMGIKVGELNRTITMFGAALFYDVEFPPGWARVALPHAMWSEVRDEAGQLRMKVFYKASAYDRRAYVDFEVKHG